ncbi:two-component system sensor histidine kinase KdpD|uniref:histidine kinase n=1 Tax=Brenneria salicis ATCC 15712 = DSM 30166 TaxID=714314 RepID=A0A366I565_9GAMM|nr:two-component system sensor histidine kinase KdpD [Brenneria salicis]NMN90771.1 two-component system sensor histidine kinase KdpD [Brenneria salicis ATCC 15712 = DSM 30166]RBP63490.1 two-component system sensor histidine kinase KdpD [Brenneria salicis ATCC 15712 = DSM 30166]RLM30919.1 two-component system sensor histidine kinase KdbD [Brenneria salicis ATCC 15712 = DSM 30166]
MTEEPQRPDPDALLAQTDNDGRGKLKIFFGACAGVGKTWAMLQEARRLRAQGLDVLVGVVETHGRQETAALLEGLEILPRRATGHNRYQEFDLDAALARRPAVILMDELAHSNTRGSLHPKRWQDIDELLDAGIDVLTTVNVQHLESLNDVVSGVTGIRVRETVPDPFFDSASEVVLVDLPPDDLRQRLKEGKVYVGDRAERAIENFFRKGNLFALRELALRRTADRVDDQMRAWRDARGREEKVWHTRDAILLCIGANTGSEKLVRIAARLAAKLGSEWHAVTVETPTLHRQGETRRRAILRTLQLAQNMGAVTATLSDPNEAEAVLRYAREHNLGKIIVGRPPQRRWRFSHRFASRLSRLGPDLDLVIVALDDMPEISSGRVAASRVSTEKWRQKLRGCLAAAALCMLITLVCKCLLPGFSLINLVMIYLLGVVLIAIGFGRLPSVVAAVLNIIAFDLFFVAPAGSFAVMDAQYLVTFSVMLAVGVITGNMTAGVRYQARVARHREQRARYLYELADGLSRALLPADVTQICQQVVSAALLARCEIWLPDKQGVLVAPSERRLNTMPDPAIIKWSFDKGQVAGAGTDTLPGVPYKILPLASSGRTLGLLVIEPSNLRHLMIPEQQRLLDTFLVIISGALERLELTRREQQSRLAAEREELRNSLLSALSHDLRTPLTVLFGQAEILMLDLSEEGSKYVQQANEMRQQTLSTISLVNNMLDMARIESDGFRLKTDWVSLEEVVGSALKSLETILSTHSVQLDLPKEMVLLQADGPLLERVFVNLLENALKYAGNKSTIGIKAHLLPGKIRIDVWDNGPGIPPGKEQQIFEKFIRGREESAIPGVGMGLAICRAIVAMHHGEIKATNRPENGACFTLILPLPPVPLLAENLEENL